MSFWLWCLKLLVWLLYLILIQDSSKLLIAADKTTNFYRLDKDAYNKLLDDNINTQHLQKKRRA